jgi:prephenate dehydrogenase
MESNRDESTDMKRIRMIDEGLYKDILAYESKLYINLQEKIDDLKMVKDLTMAFEKKEARRLFDNLLAEKKDLKR